MLISEAGHKALKPLSCKHILQARESVLRTLHPASQDIRSLMAQKKQMSASQPLVFPLRHYIKKTPDIISGANQIRGTTQILCFCLQNTQYA